MINKRLAYYNQIEQQLKGQIVKLRSELRAKNVELGKLRKRVRIVTSKKYTDNIAKEAFRSRFSPARANCYFEGHQTPKCEFCAPSCQDFEGEIFPRPPPG
jgi:hypothetical protein